MKRVSVLSYGVGNLRSVQRALSHVGADVRLVTTPAEVVDAELLILPGVGAFRHCADSLRQQDLWEPIAAHLASDKPFLGICVGMQLMMQFSEEFGQHEGFGLIPGRVQRLPDQDPQKVPMVGWKAVTPVNTSQVFSETDSFYFVHSFAAAPQNTSDVLASYNYGSAQITAAVGRGNKIGTQFHPEKSGDAGLAFLERVVRA